MFYIPHYPTYENLPFLLCFAPHITPIWTPSFCHILHHALPHLWKTIIFVITCTPYYPNMKNHHFCHVLHRALPHLWKIIISFKFYTPTCCYYPTWEILSFLLWFAPHITLYMKNCSFIMLHIPYYLFIFDIRGGIWRLIKAFSESLRKLKSCNRKWSYCPFYTKILCINIFNHCFLTFLVGVRRWLHRRHFVPNQGLFKTVEKLKKYSWKELPVFYELFSKIFRVSDFI